MLAAPRFTQEQDPADWCAVIAILFLALLWWRLGIPSQIYFDEIHYVTAARHQNEGVRFNPEHPVLGKSIIAAAIRWLGDAPLNWRIPSAISGAIGLYALGRLVWFVTGRRLVTLVAMFLVATDFAWFVQSRIAMLDMFMAMFGMVSLWLAASAVRLPQQGRWRLAAAGIAMGLALGAKWSVAPLLAVPGLAFLGWKLRDCGWRGLYQRDGGAVPGISLVEAGIWLGLVPLVVYWLTFWPAFFWVKDPVNPWDPVGWHSYMLQLQDSVTRPHPYRSWWYQWIGNWRAIWFLYQQVDGAQRGILLIGNPFTMLAGLAAIGWCLWAGWRGRTEAWIFAGLYAIQIAFWALSSKPVQFYYHYLLPGTFLMVCLALALEGLWQRADRWRWLAAAALAISLGMFIHFYPILSAGPLCCGRPSFEAWMWLRSWR